MTAVGEKFGRAMLEKMGWRSGTGLGAKRNGCIEPLAVKSRPEKLGVGAERRVFQDAWWEKAFEDAYGRSADNADDKNLLSACEGRRCRPHGSGKLARLAKQDTLATSLAGSEETASERITEREERRKAVSFVATNDMLESTKILKGGANRKFTALRESSVGHADVGHEGLKRGELTVGKDTSENLVVGSEDGADGREGRRKRSKREKRVKAKRPASTNDKSSPRRDGDGKCTKRSHFALGKGKVSSGRVRKLRRKP
jgi:hypothetical protein